jgi:outer membrane protein OmpA-like peptidoglycan-associated protein
VFLKKVSEYLKASAVLSIKVIGHTDDMGSPEYNKVLSIKRANNIKIFLREMGVRQPIYAEGMGEMAPVQRCKGCEQKNRRVEIKIKI